MVRILPNRVALYLTIAGDLVAALAPFILDFGGSEKVVAYVGTILAANLAVITWLRGWQQYEERMDLIEAGVPGYGPVSPDADVEDRPVGSGSTLDRPTVGGKAGERSSGGRS